MNINELKRIIDHSGTYRDSGYPSNYQELKIIGHLSKMITTKGGSASMRGEHYRATYHDDGRLELDRIGDKELYEAIAAGDVPDVQRMMDSQR